VVGFERGVAGLWLDAVCALTWRVGWVRNLLGDDGREDGPSLMPGRLWGGTTETELAGLRAGAAEVTLTLEETGSLRGETGRGTFERVVGRVGDDSVKVSLTVTWLCETGTEGGWGTANLSFEGVLHGEE